jgi:hypothetical protein
MPVSSLALLTRVKPLRHDQVQFVLGPRHGHIQKAPFFLDLFWGAGRDVRRDAAVYDVQAYGP